MACIIFMTAISRENIEKMKNDIRKKFFKPEQMLEMIDFLPDPTFVIDTEGRVIIWNHAIEELTGIDADDMTGRGDFEYSIPFYKARRPILADLVLHPEMDIENKYPSFVKKNDTYSGEVFVPGIREGGAYLWGIAKPLYDDRGNIIGAIESIRDISEHKEAEALIARQKEELIATNEQLKFSEEKFLKAFKSSPMVVSISTVAEGRYVDVSDSFYENTGYTKEEVIGHTAFDINIWADLSDRERILKEMKEKGRVRDMVINFRQKDGGIRTKLFSSDIIMLNGVPHLLAINGDITEIKAAEETIRRQKSELENVNDELKRTIEAMEKAHSDLLMTQKELLESNEKLRFSEEKFSKTVHLGPVIITLSKISDGTYVDVSDYFLKLTGYTREEVIGHSSIELGIWADPADRERMVEMLRNDGVVREAEFNFRSRHGNHYVMRYSAEIITIADIPHLVSIAIDITERKKAQEEKEKLEQQFLQSQKMETVGRLAGGIAHDFNNLLTAIMGNTEISLMKMEKENPLYNRLQIIKRASESAADLTRRILAFSRKQILDPSPIDLNEMIEHMDKMLVRLIGEDVYLITTSKAEKPVIKADPGQVEQIIVNLAVNARDAMPDGGAITIETVNTILDSGYCRTHAYVVPGEYVMLSISDTGTGMSREVKDHLFEPFYTTKPKGRGTGLGLSMVYGAVKQSNGTIEVYSEEGKGTSFKIYFPVYKGEVHAAAEVRTEHELPAGNETVLLVEDNILVLDFASGILEQAGFRVLESASAETALTKEKSFTGPIDILITDVVLPGMNGKALAEYLSAKRPGLKVLFTSGYTENFIAHQGVLDDGINFIGKPYSAHSLLRKVREILDRR